MQVFVVCAVSRPQELGAAVEARFPRDHLKLAEREWLVAADGLTSREVCDALAITDGGNGNAVVVAMDAYWGRAAGSIWEWIATRKASANGH